MLGSRWKMVRYSREISQTIKKVVCSREAIKSSEKQFSTFNRKRKRRSADYRDRSVSHDAHSLLRIGRHFFFPLHALFGELRFFPSTSGNNAKNANALLISVSQ